MKAIGAGQDTVPGPPARSSDSLGPGGGGVSARVSELRRRHPADRVPTAFRVRNHP